MTALKWLKVVSGWAGMVHLCSTSFAAVLISDDFNNAGSAHINGRTPSLVDPSLDGKSWLAPTDNFVGNDAGGLTATLTSSTNRTMGIDMGASYFATHQGLHEISIQTQRTSESSASSWVGIGFTSSLSTDVNMTQAGSAGNPWMISRMSGPTVVFRGPGATSQFSTTPSTTPTSLNTFRIVLDTSGDQWTVQAFYNENPVLHDGQPVVVLVTKPTELQYLAVSSGHNTTDATALVDNFSYSFTPIPEPALTLLSLAGLPLLMRRRR